MSLTKEQSSGYIVLNERYSCHKQKEAALPKAGGGNTYTKEPCTCARRSSYMYSSLCAIYSSKNLFVFYLTILILTCHDVQRLCKIRFINYDTKTKEKGRGKTPDIILKAIY